ncbi:MAG: AAA family ATPase, partial [Bacilli bacterium]|nr:AAA family ATPase [Bacilli bacterium]
LGYLNDDDIFITENQEYSLGNCMSKIVLEDDTNELVFGSPILFDELQDLYEEKDLSKQMHKYFLEISNNITIARIRNSEVNLNVVPLSEVGNTKAQDEKPAAPAVQKEKDGLEHLSHIDNFALEDYVKERVFDADDIIEDICTTIAMNYRAKNKKNIRTMLSIGPTGSGKTMTYQVIAEYLGVPLTIYDCNSITSAGYVGKDIEDSLKEVYINSQKNPKIAAKSILAFDEVDKLASRGSDVKDIAVQQALLKLLEGYNYRFPLVKNGAEVSLDTSFMTIACLGAFSTLFESKEKHMGFNPITEDEKYDVTEEDLIGYGMARELVGRWKHLFVYKAQTKDSLRRILLESKWSPLLLQQERLLSEFNTELIWDESFIDAYIEEAFKRKAGGRSLSKIGANTFIKLERELLRLNSENPDVKRKVLVNGETIYN